jgi:hypothetical protein
MPYPPPTRYRPDNKKANRSVGFFLQINDLPESDVERVMGTSSCSQLVD